MSLCAVLRYRPAKALTQPRVVWEESGASIAWKQRGTFVDLDSGATIEVDISTRVLQDDDKIYVIQPGEGYWLYDHFKRSGTVFLDFPDLEIDFSTRPTWQRFREIIVRSIAIAE